MFEAAGEEWALAIACGALVLAEELAGSTSLRRRDCWRATRPRAEVATREACETAEATAVLGNFMGFCCNLAQALLKFGRDDEAEQWLERGRVNKQRNPPEDAVARRGELQEDERLAREAVAVAAETDMLNARADALIDLAEVLALAAGLAGGARTGARTLRAKGHLVIAERTRSRLAELTAPQ